MGNLPAVCANNSWSPVSEGFVGDPWLSIVLTVCHILHPVSHACVELLHQKSMLACKVGASTLVGQGLGWLRAPLVRT
jgi:hypothetical protein